MRTCCAFRLFKEQEVTNKEGHMDNITNVPQHVAIILDGNGRWAKAKGMPRNYGHKQGAKAVEDILLYARDIGIKYLTVYAFSTENWSRPESEVSALMTILRTYLKTSIKKSMKNNVRCRVIGEKSALAEDLQKVIAELEEATAGNTGLTFTIAINYGSRDEITRAVRKVAEKVEKGELKAADITEKDIADNLDTNFLPDPDLLIRTCNEQRISNYLLWQCAYTEFYFADVAWPDFDKNELLKAVEAYGNRTRKFGGLKTDQ
jgi:undecaprenyl diphosphate synthase